uniref:Uncharacterized protein n=1 Tax=Tanacetum cinerariifolium TaxID=118510 RepID=A0A6L2M8C5_TANCI|nr:hypothetical protein [Tanacetum cinerariifolium]
MELKDIFLMMVMLIWCNMMVIELILLVFFGLDFINTTNGHQFNISNRQERIGYSRVNGNCSKTVNSVKQIHAKVDGKAVVISESLVRSGLLFDDEDGNVTPLFNKMLVQNQAPKGEGHTSRSGEGKPKENIELTDTVPTSYDSPLTGGYIPGSDEGRITLAELMETCITLSNRVTQLENELSTTKAVYNNAFITLTNRVKKLESQLKQKRREDTKEMDKDENINLVSEQGEVQETTKHSRDDDDGTLAETLLNVKRSSAKDKGKRNHARDKATKEVKEERNDLAGLDKELAQKLYAEELAKEGAIQKQEIYNLEKAFELQRQLDQRKENVPKGDQAKEIEWNDPQQESSKKQRLDQQTEETEEEAESQGNSDQEVEELKLYMRIIPGEDIAIEAIPLAIKPSVIIEYKIVKEGKISTYHITRAVGSTRRYTSMINLLENIDREDLETLWETMKDKYGNTRPKEWYERVLWGDLKVMFELDIESEVWRKLQCGVHFVRFKNLHIFLLDKVYPLTPATIKMILERKLQADQWNEMCYQLLKLIMKQLRKK